MTHTKPTYIPTDLEMAALSRLSAAKMSLDVTCAEILDPDPPRPINIGAVDELATRVLETAQHAQTARHLTVFFGLVLLLMLLPSRALAQTPTPEWHAKITHAAIGAGMVAHAADLSTTMFGLGQGTLAEGNPIMRPFTDRGPVPAAIAKGSLAVASSYALIRLHKTRPKLALALAIGQTVGISIVAHRNTRLLR